MNERQAADKDFLKASKIDPDNSRIYYNRASISKTNYEIPQAIKDFNIAVSINDSSLCKCCVHWQRGKAREILKNKDTALDDYKAVLEASPSHTGALSELAYHHWNLAEWDKAQEYLEKQTPIYEEAAKNTSPQHKWQNNHSLHLHKQTLERFYEARKKHEEKSKND